MLPKLNMVKKQAAKPSSSKSKLLSKSNGKAGNNNSNKKSDGDQAVHHPSEQHEPLDSAHQQKLLNIFQSTFNSVLTSNSFHTTLQEVKTALFNREFDKAFGREEYLEAYAARWSPTRALCYASVLSGIAPHLGECTDTIAATPAKPIKESVVGDTGLSEDGNDAAKHDDSAGLTHNTSENAIRKLKVLAIGGAAAEAVAFGSFLSQQNQRDATRPWASDITLLDIAPWTNVVDKLRIGLTTPPTLSKYASAAAQAGNTALVRPEQLQSISFRQQDVLALSKDELTSLIAAPQPQSQSQPVLATLLFTLNELFTAGGIGKTTAFLLTLTSALPAGSLLLVVDSPGSYSETTVGKEAKRYPMQWLLDKILLGTGARGDHDDDDTAWEKVESTDSVWFRLGQELRYSIQLEDMRYQMHLYRRAGAEGDVGAD